MEASGVLQRLERKWVRMDEINNPSQIIAPQVTFEHISGILIVYGAAAIASISILGIEFLHMRYLHGHNYGMKTICHTCVIFYVTLCIDYVHVHFCSNISQISSRKVKLVS